MTDSAARERDIAWSPDGVKVYFASDMDGTNSIYAATVTKTRGDIKDAFKEKLGLDDEEGDDDGEEADGDTGDDDEGETDEGDNEDGVSSSHGLAGQWDGMYMGPAEVFAEGGMPFSVMVTVGSDGALSGSADAMGATVLIADVVFDSESGEFSFTVSGLDGDIEVNGTVDGNTMTGTWRRADGSIEGTLNAERARDEAGGDAAGADGEKGKGDKDDEDDVDPAERWHDAIRFAVEPVVQGALNDREAVPSPDGKSLAFRRSRGDIMVLDLETGNERTLLESWDPWSEWAVEPGLEVHRVCGAGSQLQYGCVGCACRWFARGGEHFQASGYGFESALGCGWEDAGVFV